MSEGCWQDGFWMYHSMSPCPDDGCGWVWCFLNEVWYKRVGGIFNGGRIIKRGRLLSSYIDDMELDDLSSRYMMLRKEICIGDVKGVIERLFTAVTPCLAID
jgi:hypothetical protein